MRHQLIILRLLLLLRLGVLMGLHVLPRAASSLPRRLIFHPLSLVGWTQIKAQTREVNEGSNEAFTLFFLTTVGHIGVVER